jgi:UDP-N-acetylmuramate--alanine ligase
VTAPEKILLRKEELMEYLDRTVTEEGRDLVVTMGAGDIDRLINPVKELLKDRKKC